MWLSCFEYKSALCQTQTVATCDKMPRGRKKVEEEMTWFLFLLFHSCSFCCWWTEHPLLKWEHQILHYCFVWWRAREACSCLEWEREWIHQTYIQEQERWELILTLEQLRCWSVTKLTGSQHFVTGWWLTGTGTNTGWIRRKDWRSCWPEVKGFGPEGDFLSKIEFLPLEGIQHDKQATGFPQSPCRK